MTESSSESWEEARERFGFCETLRWMSRFEGFLSGEDIDKLGVGLGGVF
jgi:hypothetical protein